MKKNCFFLICTIMYCLGATPLSAEETLKQSSVFYTADMVEKARTNANKFAWASDIVNSIIANARPWLKYSDDELWDLMFGSTISRSWMVWSDGYCPSCKEDISMYSWEMNAINEPWKVRCPNCGELFPKNDFHAFYRSGLDTHGVFDPELADRSLLFNTEHPDPDDPLQMYGVDDGEGYVEGERRWRFIGAYLIYGQWKQAIVSGIQNLAAAYVISGDDSYAHKAGILLDRVADLYPTFDFKEQGIVYERPGDAGYISTWHGACYEHRIIVTAYDQVFEALRRDTELVAFLSGKARQYKLDNPKSTFTHIQRNIEDRILHNAISNHQKIMSNYPRTEVVLAITRAVLNWPENRGEVFAIIDSMVVKATAVDGLSGEKGLVGYSSSPISIMAHLLEMFARIDPVFLPDIVKRHPNIRKTYRFHIDTWFNGEYFPLTGDTGSFAQKVNYFPTATPSKNPGIGPSMFSFLWHLYELTGDHAYVQILYRQNNNSIENLPYDLFAGRPEAFQKAVQSVIDKHGDRIEVGSVNKEQWCLSMMRSGRGEKARAFWLDYDTGERHSHADCMNLGLFAKGLDLLPEFGYPAVQYGGWETSKARWSKMTAAHNTVVVCGKDQTHEHVSGTTTLWADGDSFRAIRASAPEVYNIDQYERTVVFVDISDKDSYLIDAFRVVGSTDHAKFIHSHFGTITTRGLSLKPADDYGHGTIMRNFYSDPLPNPGWHVDWKVNDKHGYLPADSDVHVRYTDLTTDARAFTAEAWISGGTYNEREELWIPRVITRRQAEESPLASTFVSIIEPYEKSSNITGIRRLQLMTEKGKLYPDANVAIEITLKNGYRDVFIISDVENPLNLSPSRAVDKILVQEDSKLLLDGEICMVRSDRLGEVNHIALCRGKSLTFGSFEIVLTKDTGFIELVIDGGRAEVVAGSHAAIHTIKAKGKNIRVE